MSHYYNTRRNNIRELRDNLLCRCNSFNDEVNQQAAEIVRLKKELQYGNEGYQLLQDEIEKLKELLCICYREGNLSDEQDKEIRKIFNCY